MIEFKQSKVLDALARELNEAWDSRRELGMDEEADQLVEALEAAVFPSPDQGEFSYDEWELLLKEARKSHKNAWVADNDHEGMVDMGLSMLRAGLQIASLLKEGESVFSVDLAFGGEMEHESFLFLSGTEEAAASLLRGVLERFPVLDVEEEGEDGCEGEDEDEGDEDQD